MKKLADSFTTDISLANSKINYLKEDKLNID